jgi:hypothetical protein
MTTTQHCQVLVRKLGELLAEPHTELTAGLVQKYRAARLAVSSCSSEWPWSNKTIKEMVQDKVSTAAHN